VLNRGVIFFSIFVLTRDLKRLRRKNKNLSQREKLRAKLVEIMEKSRQSSRSGGSKKPIID
jgi:hypothetical protein